MSNGVRRAAFRLCARCHVHFDVVITFRVARTPPRLIKEHTRLRRAHVRRRSRGASNCGTQRPNVTPTSCLCVTRDRATLLLEHPVCARVWRICVFDCACSSGGGVIYNYFRRFDLTRRRRSLAYSAQMGSRPRDRAVRRAPCVVETTPIGFC